MAFIWIKLVNLFSSTKEVWGRFFFFSEESLPLKSGKEDKPDIEGGSFPTHNWEMGEEPMPSKTMDPNISQAQSQD